jgi:hypothetical protein
MSPAEPDRQLSPSALIGARLVAEALRTLIETLEACPELAGRLRGLLLVEVPAVASTVPPFMSISEYARHARVSVRTVQSLRAEMTEGLHYHRDGRTGRRVIIHVAEADAWRSARRPHQLRRDLDRLAEDETARRRARTGRREGPAG